MGVMKIAELRLASNAIMDLLKLETLVLRSAQMD